MSDVWYWITKYQKTYWNEEPEYDTPIDWDRLTQDEMIDNEEEYPREQ